MEYEWGQLTSACPQQFLITRDNVTVAYLRIRGGCLSVNPAKDNEDCTDFDIDYGTLIYEKEYEDKYLGVITKEDMDTVVSEVEEALTEYLSKQNAQKGL